MGKWDDDDDDDDDFSLIFFRFLFSAPYWFSLELWGRGEKLISLASLKDGATGPFAEFLVLRILSLYLYVHCMETWFLGQNSWFSAFEWEEHSASSEWNPGFLVRSCLRLGFGSWTFCPDEGRWISESFSALSRSKPQHMAHRLAICRHRPSRRQAGVKRGDQTPTSARPPCQPIHYMVVVEDCY